MASDGSVRIDTELDESGLKSGLSGLSGKIGGLASSGFAVLTGAIAATTAAMGAGAIAGVQYNATMESYKTSFATMLGSAEDAEKLTNTLKDLGASTPFEMTDLANTTQTLMSFGLTADDAVGTLQMLGDISQGNADKLGTVSRAFGKMSSSGKVSLEDINMMIDSGFNPLQEISQTTGESMASLYDRISDGKISVDEITESMKRSTSEGGMYFESMQAQSQTFNGLMSTLKDNAMGLLGSITEGIQGGLVGGLLPAAIDAIGQLTEAFETGGAEGLIQAGGEILNNVTAGITAQLPGIVNTAMSIISALAGAIISNIPAILSAGGQILDQLITYLAFNGQSLASQGTQMLINLANGIAKALPELIPKVAMIISQIVKGIISNMPQILQAGINLLIGLGTGILNAIPILIRLLPKVIESIKTAFKEIDWGEIGKNIMNGIGKGLINAVSSTVKAAKEAVGSVVDGVKNFLGIHSPSTVMRDLIGKNMMAGISVGVNDETPNMITDVKGNVARLVSGVQTEVSGIGARIGIGSTTGAASKTTEETDKIDYEKLGSAVTKSFVSAGIGISLNGREFGRVIADLD